MSLRLLERLGVALLLLAALVPRARDLSGPFDREFDGFQGSCFAAFCVNYERLGFEHFGGYPSFFVDFPDEGEAARAGARAGEAFDETRYVYANHPAFVPLLLWVTVQTFGPEGWDRAWVEARPPEGIEFALRLPTFLFHALGLLAFWWMLRQAGGSRLALIGLGLMAMTPISIVYAQLVNYENISLCLVCVAYGFYARHARGRPGRNLLGCVLWMGAACAVTFAPLFFVPPLLLMELRRRGLGSALRFLAGLAPAALLPVLLHATWVRLALPPEASATVAGRVGDMIGPLFSGELSFVEWLRRQALRIGYFFSAPLALAALIGLGLALMPRRAAPDQHTAEAPQPPVDLGAALFLGGALYLLAFFRHTFDGDGARNGQTMFLLDVAPGLVALAAGAFERLAAPLASLRGGIAPLVVAVSLAGMPGVARANAIRREWREPGPEDPGGSLRGPAVALPSTIGRELGALVPAGAIGFYPEALSFTQAHAYYAWRTLISVRHESFGQRLGLLDLMGLGERDKFLILPRSPSAAVREEIGDVRDQLAGAGPPFAEDERWEVWRLPED